MCLQQRDSGQFLFKTMFEHNPKLIQIVDPDVLFQKMDGEVWVLYWLAGTAIGHEILKFLFAGNAKLARSIRAEALCEVAKVEADAVISMPTPQPCIGCQQNV